MSTRLPKDDYLAALERTAQQITEMVERADPALEIPSCPGWTVADLVAHLGGVHGWARGIVGGAGPKSARPKPKGDLAEWYADQARQLLDALRSADAQAEAWSFTNDRSVGFWIRRQPHEAEMHRLDLAIALGEKPTYAAELAADAVSEVFDVMIPRRHAKDIVAVSEVMRFTSTDTGDDWVLRPSDQPGVVDYQHDRTGGAAHPPLSVTVSATASELATGMWGRTPYSLWGLEGARAPLDTLMNSGVTP